MTIPSERSIAVCRARKFLRDLLDPKKTPRVPFKVRTRALSLLKHFPTPLDVGDWHKDHPNTFDAPDPWSDVFEE